MNRRDFIWLSCGLLVLAVLGCNRVQPARQADQQPPVLAIGADPTGKLPELEILNGAGDFGSADYGMQRSCDLKVRNNTSRLLTLEIVNKSCTCAGVHLESPALPPGQTASIRLLWTPKVETIESGMVRVWAEVRGNPDMQPIRLEATGRMEPKIQCAFPRGPLEFDKLSPGDLKNASHIRIIEIYSKTQSFELTRIVSTLPGIRVIVPFEPLPSDRMLSLQAQCGFRLQVQANAELPVGRFIGALKLTTSFHEQALEIPLSGSFETSVIGVSRDRIELPPRIDLRTGYKAPAVLLTVRHGQCSQCQVQAVSPEWLQVKITRQADAVWKVDVSIPRQGDEAFSKLNDQERRQLRDFGFDSGQLILSLDHPETPRLTIPITGSLLGFD